jgi:hypothetical protein
MWFFLQQEAGYTCTAKSSIAVDKFAGGSQSCSQVWFSFVSPTWTCSILWRLDTSTTGSSTLARRRQIGHQISPLLGSILPSPDKSWHPQLQARSGIWIWFNTINSTVQHLNSTSRQAFPLQPQHTIACPSNYQENISCIGLGKNLRNCCQDSAVEQEMNGNSQSKPDASAIMSNTSTSMWASCLQNTWECVS